MSLAQAGRLFTTEPLGKLKIPSLYKTLWIFTNSESCSYHCNIMWNSFTSLNIFLYFMYSIIFCPLPSRKPATTYLLTLSLVLSFPESSRNWIIYYVVFSDYFLLLSKMYLKFIFVFAWFDSLFLLFIYLFIWLHWVLVVAHGIFVVGAGSLVAAWDL